MQLDITHFFTSAGMIDYSASIAEVGQNAASDTWNAAKDDSADYPLLTTDEQREAFRAYVKGFGAWDAEEIASWDDIELNALCMQMIAGNVREAESVVGCHRDEWTDAEWSDYESQAEEGRIAGLFYRGDDGRIYTYIGE